MRKTNKTLSLPVDVVDRLEQEEDMSARVATLLRDYYNLGAGGSGADIR